MFPTYFGLPSYGLIMGLGVALCYYLAWRLGRREGMHKDIAVDVTLIVLFGGLIGCRLMHIIEHWEVYSAAPWVEMLRVDKGGLSWYGCFFTIIPTTWLYARAKGMRFWAIIDLGTIYVPIAQAFGRVGCFAAGCCWGQRVAPGDLLAPIAVRYPVGSPAWADQVAMRLGVERMSLPELQAVYPTLPPDLQAGSYAVIPVQLFMSAAGIAITLFFLWYYGRHRRHGQAFSATFTLLALSRFGLEWLRADNPMIGQFSQHQWISLACAAAGFTLWILFARWGAAYVPPDQRTPPAADGGIGNGLAAIRDR